ncbi:beta-glucosidase 44-like protein, partial [Trifolium pratense]
EDIDLMAKLNFDAYRFSISWSRIFPNGTGKVNWKGVAYYNRLIDYLLEKGITPYANLYHYDLPLALELKYNGLLSRNVVVYRPAIVASLFIVMNVVIVNKIETSRKNFELGGDPPGELTL